MLKHIFLILFSLGVIGVSFAKESSNSMLGFSTCIQGYVVGSMRASSAEGSGTIDLKEAVEHCIEYLDSAEANIQCVNPMLPASNPDKISALLSSLEITSDAQSKKFHISYAMADSQKKFSANCTLSGRSMKCDQHNLDVPQAYLNCYSSPSVVPQDNAIFGTYYPGENKPTYYKCVPLLEQPAVIYNKTVNNSVYAQLQKSMRQLWETYYNPAVNPTLTPAVNPAVNPVELTKVNQCELMNKDKYNNKG